MVKYRCLALAISVFSPLLFSAPLSLKETLEFAIQNSPTLQKSKIQRQLADYDVSDRRSAFLPSLDFESSVGLAKEKFSFPEEPWRSALNLKLTENLYDNGKSFTLLSKANLAREIAEVSLKRDRDKLVLDVTLLLYQYSNVKNLTLAKKDQLELIQKQFSSVGSQYQGGLRTRRDYLRFKTEAQSAELQARQAQNDVEKLKTSLRKLLGDETNTLDFAVIPVESLPSTETKIDLQNSQTYEYRIADLTTRLSNYDVTLAQQAYWPNLNLSGGLSYGNSQFINSQNSFRDTENYNANIGLTLTFNLWDWGIRSRQIERARSSVSIAENDLKSKRLEVSELLKNLNLDFETLQSNFALSQELLKAQEDAYKLIRRDYQDGQVTYTDLIDSLAKLLAAKTQFFESRYQLAGAIARYHYYQGTLYETALK